MTKRVQSGRAGAAGFTIMELLFAISLAAVAMAIVGPPTARVFDRQGLRATRNEVLAAHTYARALAVQYGRPTRLEISSARIQPVAQVRNEWLGSLTIEADTTVAGTGYEKVRRIRIVKGTMISNRARLCFDARGFPMRGLKCESPDATIILRVATRADTLRFSAIGELLP